MFKRGATGQRILPSEPGARQTVTRLILRLLKARSAATWTMRCLPDSAKGRYSPAECTGCCKHRIEGNPDPKHISTSFAERSNLTLRMHTRRFTRLTNGFSKKVENHAHSVALFALYYNFIKIHKTLRTTPAMAAGVTKRLWEMGDIVDVLEAWEDL